LRKIAEHGPKAFYEGDVARSLARKLQSVGGLHTEEDLAAARSNYATPVNAGYRDHDVYECPPAGQGLAALMILRTIEGCAAPPVGYLQRVCDKHGIFLIFDEVVTGFGRLGAPFAAQALGVTPDLITCAKGMTNGAVPMGGVLVQRHVYEALSQGADAVELAHGYTYSGDPPACAAALAALAVYAEEGLFQPAARMAPHWEDALHGVRDASPAIRDIRNIGPLGAVDIASDADAFGQRARGVAEQCFAARAGWRRSWFRSPR
jgi:adenosylmethionine-8-amino-7-oxononanoate aminotransferase